MEKGRHADLTEGSIGAAIEVHRHLGPGLLESTCESCLRFELVDRGFRVEKQKALPVLYRVLHLECGYRIDFMVNELVLLELKAVDQLHPIHEAQVLSYLKLSGLQTALLINFNTRRLAESIKRLSL